MKLKMIPILTILLTLFISCVTTQAKDATITINGQVLPCDVPPRIVEDRTMVPVRAIFEALNYSVDYDSDSQIITATGSNETIRMQIGVKTLFKITNENYMLESDVAPMIIHNRTFIPLRATAKILGCGIDWDADSYTAAITTIKSIKITNTSDLNGANNYEADCVTYDGNAYYYFTLYDGHISLFKETNGIATKLCTNISKYPKGLTEYGNYLYFVDNEKLYRISKNGGELETLTKNVIDIYHDNNILYFSKLNGIYNIGFGKINPSDFDSKATLLVDRTVDDFQSNSRYGNASERLLVKDGFIYYTTYKGLNKMNIQTGKSILIADTNDANTININILDDYIYYNDDKAKIVKVENKEKGKTKTLIRGTLAIWSACDYDWANAYKDAVYVLARDDGDVALVKVALDGSEHNIITTIKGNVYYDNLNLKMSIAGDYAFIYNMNGSSNRMKFYRVNIKTGELKNTFLPNIVN